MRVLEHGAGLPGTEAAGSLPRPLLGTPSTSRPRPPLPPQALEKLSHDHPASLLRAGALVAVLSYVDFFQTGVQRVAVATAANMCRGLTVEHAEAATTAAPILINLLQYQVGRVPGAAGAGAGAGAGLRPAGEQPCVRGEERVGKPVALAAATSPAAPPASRCTHPRSTPPTAHPLPPLRTPRSSTLPAWR